MYEQDIRVTKNEKEAVIWYGKSSLKQDGLAIGNLGMLYVSGQGLQINYIAGIS